MASCPSIPCAENLGRSGHRQDKGQPARETTRTMEIEPPTHARVDPIASAICEAGRRSRSRSEESPNAVVLHGNRFDGVDARARRRLGVHGSDGFACRLPLVFGGVRCGPKVSAHGRLG